LEHVFIEKAGIFLRTCASGMAVADIAAEPKQPKPMPAAKTNVKLVFMA
jgi:hypothetical protein